MRADDPDVLLAVQPGLEDVLGHLRGLAAASVPRDDHHAVSIEFGDDLCLVFGDGQDLGGVAYRL